MGTEADQKTELEPERWRFGYWFDWWRASSLGPVLFALLTIVQAFVNPVISPLLLPLIVPSCAALSIGGWRFAHRSWVAFDDENQRVLVVVHSVLVQSSPFANTVVFLPDEGFRLRVIPVPVDVVAKPGLPRQRCRMLNSSPYVASRRARAFRAALDDRSIRYVIEDR